MIDPFEMAREMYEARLYGLYRSLPSFALAAFIVGVALTQVLNKHWPSAGNNLLIAATVLAFVNALISYRIMLRSKAIYKKSIEDLRAIDPELAEKMEEVWE